MTIQVNYSEAGVKDASNRRMTATGWGPGGTISRRIRVKDWNDAAGRSDAEVALRQAVGSSVVATFGGNTVLSRDLPEVYPQAAGWGDPGLYSCAYLCRSATVVSLETWNGRTIYIPPGAPDPIAGRPGFSINVAASGRQRTKGGAEELDPTDAYPKVSRYKHATLELTYEPSDMMLMDDATIWAAPYSTSELYRMTTLRYDRTVKYFSLQGGQMYYVGVTPTTTVPFATGILEAQKTIYVKQFAVDVAAVPWLTVDYTMGKVNLDPFVTFSQTYPPGSLLYMPPRVEYYMLANGRLGCNLEHVLLYFRMLHNRVLMNKKDQDKRYYYITTDSSLTGADPDPTALPAGKFLYDGAPLANVFIPSADAALPPGGGRRGGPPRGGGPWRPFIPPPPWAEPVAPPPWAQPVDDPVAAPEPEPPLAEPAEDA